WCQHCVISKGCSIYEERPTSCREFECVWLQDEKGIFADEMRPDRCKVVMIPYRDGNGLEARCDPSRPDAWRNQTVIRALVACADQGWPAMIQAGNKVMCVGTKGVWQVPESNIIRRDENGTDVSVPNEVMEQYGIGRPSNRPVGATRVLKVGSRWK